jgi:hypothetical protein
MPAMKPGLFLLLSIVFFAGCKEAGRPYLPVAFTLNKADKEKGKTLVYIDRSTNKYHYNDLFYIKKGNRKYLVRRWWDEEGVYDSALQSATHTLETYSTYLNDGVLNKGEILLDTIIDNGKKFGKSRFYLRHKGDSFQYDLSSVMEFVKDTVFTWQGKILPTIELTILSEYFLKEGATGKSKPYYSLETWSYYAKGIGLVRTREHDRELNTYSTTDLVEIKDLIR